MSRTVKCEFCGNQRSIKATTAGLLEQQYDELLNFESSDRYDERQKAALAYAEAIAWRLDVDDEFWDRLHSHFTEPELVELGCFVALTFGQQSWIRLLDIDHHEYMAGTDASMAPGFETRRGAGRDQGRAGLLGQGVSLLLAEEGPVQYRLAPTMDGLYTPYALRRPDGKGPHPFVFLAYGNGGGGLPWLRERIVDYPYVMRRLLRRGLRLRLGPLPLRGRARLPHRRPAGPGPPAGHGPVQPVAAGVRGRGRDPRRRTVAARDRPGADRPRRGQPRRRDALQDRLGVPGRGHRRGRLRAGQPRVPRPRHRRDRP